MAAPLPNHPHLWHDQSLDAGLLPLMFQARQLRELKIGCIDYVAYYIYPHVPFCFWAYKGNKNY